MNKLLSYVFVVVSFFLAVPLHANDTEDNKNIRKRKYNQIENKNKVIYKQNNNKKKKVNIKETFTEEIVREEQNFNYPNNITWEKMVSVLQEKITYIWGDYVKKELNKKERIIFLRAFKKLYNKNLTLAKNGSILISLAKYMKEVYLSKIDDDMSLIDVLGKIFNYSDEISQAAAPYINCIVSSKKKITKEKIQYIKDVINNLIKKRKHFELIFDVFVFILKFNNKNFNNIDRDVNNFIEQHDQKDAVNIVPLPYADFYKYLFSDNVDDVESFSNEFSPVHTEIIANQQKYNDSIDIKVKVGQAINVELEDGSICPIGYTIYFPVNPDKIEAIKVNVYGGFTKSDRIKHAYKPSKLTDVDAYLARHHIMIVDLNLPDLLDNETKQSEMTEDYMNKLQYCIQSFWKVIAENPEFIDPCLNNIKNVLKYLYGASFGGLTALMQAQNYPNTWDGYITHDAGFSGTEEDKWDFSGRRYNLRIDSIVFNDPFLVLGNAHDNNVNMRDWTNFYQKVIKAGKEHLVKTWFTYSGIGWNVKDLNDTGHFQPDNLEELLTYSSVIRDFMKKDKIVHNVALSKWINLVGLVKSYKNDVSATPEQLFLAEMYHQEYEKKRVLSEDDLKNIFCVFYAIKNEPAYLLSLIKSEPITNEHLSKGFARDYKKWIHFSKKMHKEHPNDNPIMDEFMESDPSVIAPELLGSYKKLLLKFSSCFRSHDLKNKRDYLAFIRSMRSFFVENSELINRYELDQDVMKNFEKAKKTWKDFKEEEAMAFKEVMPLFVGQDKDYGDLNFLNDFLELGE